MTTINSVSNAATSGLSSSSTSQSQTAAVSNSVSPFITKADERVLASVSVTSAQLSKFGLLKSALSDGQTAAAAMSNLSSSASASDMTTALGNFFKTFNASIAAANAAGTSTDSASAASNARRVVNDMKAALRADSATTDALKKLGLTVQSDGTLVQDAKQFAASLSSDPAGVRAAMAALGKKVDTLNGKELASNGTVGTALTSLTARNTALTAQHSALLALEQALSSSSNALTGSSGYTGMGLAAYLNNQSGS